MNPVPIIVFILVVFTVVFCVVKEVKFTIPKTSISLTLDYAVPPLLGVLVLLASGALTPMDVFNGGLIGDDRIQPFAIMIIFNGLAYLCICIDLTGLLAWIALHVAGRAGSSAFRLFGYFFLLSAIFTVFTSNDIVILTLTPIIYYCSRATNMDPMPFLFGEFFAANICSLVLLIGNPTNIIVGEANHLTFADYSMWMVAPAFVATGTAFLGCWFKYRRELEQTFIPPVLDPASAFKDKRAAVFHSAVLILTLLLLSLSPFIGARMWVICAVSAGVIFLYNLVFWPWDSTNTITESPQEIIPSSTKSYQSLGDSEKPLTNSKSNSHNSQTPAFGDKDKHSSKHGSDWAASDKGSRDKLLSVKEDGFVALDTTVMVAMDGSLTDTEAARMIPKESPLGVQLPPCLKTSLVGLPWRIVPFVFGMFVLVEGLYKGGWIDTIADFLIDNIPAGAGAGAVFVSSFLMVAVTILLCNLINNQPATILLTRVIINDKFMALPKNVRSVGMFAVILGSNLGANFTLIGALAGIMWAKILAEKNLSLTYLDFAKLGFTIMPIVTLLSAGLLFLEHI